MSYLQLRFHVQRDRADELSGVLEALGALSVTWENAGEDAYFEVAYPREPDWQRVHVTGLFDESREPDALMRQVSERMNASLVPEVRVLEEQDWERAWLTRFEPRKCRGDLWVCPSWAEPPDPDAVSIIIDPGLAFGTGDHPTTALCLDWISEHELSGLTVLDYGCGSGILAIACLLKGAARATGVDVDPRALSASELNAARNGVQERYRARYPAELPPGEQMDLVIANILSSVLVEHSGELTNATRPGGTLLLSGILEDHETRVRAAFEPAFDLRTETRDGWCMLSGRRVGGAAVSGGTAGQSA
ncbi:MAG TPA: 50S ribosomal protein L11 methyltransferase [Arenicellales bacterium]|nr:50S ribosomal protein L11 methyltransferase [Arenicellales bacterium]